MNWDKIPNELKQMRRWVCWKMITRKGKPSKQPVNALTGKPAESNNPETWASYGEAVDGVQRYALAGIGFMFGGSGIVGVDVDHCRDAETGAMTPEIQHIIETLDSYTEYSQSGEGLHILCRGQLPEGRRRKGPFEMYDTGRYFVMTGDLLDDAHGTIEDRQDQINAIHEQYVHVAKKTNKQTRKQSSETISVDDAELVRRAMAAANGPAFTRLWNGDITGYPSQSEADLAFCNLLAFWTNCDETRMTNMWRQSALWRDKCDEMHGERTYAAITISKAAADTTNTYMPPAERPRRREVQPPPGTTWEPAAQPGEQLAVQPDPDTHEIANLFLSTHDMGRSHRFAESVRGWALWCNDFNAWMIWSGRVWERDRTLRIITWAKGIVEQIVEEATAYHWRTRTDQSEELMKKAMAARSERAIKSMISLARDELAVTADAFDADPYLLNCYTGIIDLRTGQQLEHAPDYMMTKCCAAGYAPGTQWTLFGRFLETITAGDIDLSRYFQDVCGLAAIGKVLHEGMAIFFGSGRNGKSTYLNCIAQVLGDYAGSINPEALISQRDGRQNAGGLSVMGKRLIIAQETEEGRKLSSQALKKLSSTDPITERPLYENERTFTPSHTLIMATNFLPRVGSTDDGTWRRIMVVPFRACIADGVQIKGYADVMYEADRDAILAWIVEGAKRMLASGCRLVPPRCVEEMTQSYKSAEDWLGNFLYECCDVGNYSTSGSDLFSVYTSWAEGNNEHPRRARDFAAALEARGFRKRKTMTANMWDGLQVNVTHAIDKYSGRFYGG